MEIVNACLIGIIVLELYKCNRSLKRSANAMEQIHKELHIMNPTIGLLSKTAKKVQEHFRTEIIKKEYKDV